MSDRMAAVIGIGGTITKEQAQQLITLINESGGGPEFEGGIELTTILDLVDYTNEDDIIMLKDATADYGKFDDLETFLKANQIPFERHSDAKYEYDGELVVYRPEIGEIQHIANQDGNMQVSYDQVREALNMIKKGDVIKGIELLDVILGPVIPNLPPLRIE